MEERIDWKNIDWDGISKRFMEFIEGNLSNLASGENSTLPTESPDDANALTSAIVDTLGVSNEAINKDIADAAADAETIIGRVTETVSEKNRRILAERLQAEDAARKAAGLPEPNLQVDVGIAAPNSQQNPYYTGQLDTIKPQTKAEEAEEDDWMNQLLMSSLMAGGRATGRQAPSSYGVGAQVPFGDPWVMRRQWEQDYRNIG